MKQSNTKFSPAAQAQKLLAWNQEKLTHDSTLKESDLSELFAETFVVKANERTYDANYENYFEFLETFRVTIQNIQYDVQEFIESHNTVVIPLQAHVTRLNGHVDLFFAIMLLKYDAFGKIIHWQEVYSMT